MGKSALSELKPYHYKPASVSADTQVPLNSPGRFFKRVKKEKERKELYVDRYGKENQSVALL